jgi:hypothetical protein
MGAQIMIKKTCIGLAVAAAMATFGGCQTNPQPSMDVLHPEGRGIQAKNVREMADLMTRSISAKVAAVNAGNPYKVTVTVYPPKSMDGKDYGILTASLMVNLARTNNPSVAFVENRDKLEAMQTAEFGGASQGTSGGDRLLPQYLLTGEVNSIGSGATTYYLLSFKLVRIMPGATAGEVVWTDGYDLQSLN